MISKMLIMNDLRTFQTSKKQFPKSLNINEMNMFTKSAK